MEMGDNISEIKNFVKNLSFNEVKEKAQKLPYNLSVVEFNNLYMLSFTDKSNLLLPIVRSMNGVIFEKETNKLLHYSFQKAYEGIYSPYYESDKDSYKKQIKENYSIEISIEGTHIKLFWYNNVWNVATSRNIDASLSHWNADKSFKELFYEACDYENINLEDLDKEFCYSFIMQHPDNVICNEIPVPYCNMINKVNLSNHQIERTTKEFSVEYNIEQILKIVRNEKTNLNYIVYLEDSSRIKLVNENFKKIQKILKNTNSLEKCYVKSIQDGTSFLLKSNFKNKKQIFDEVDSIIDYTIKKIHNSYKNQYIYKTKEDTYYKFKKILTHIHWIHRKTSKKIDYCDIFDVLMESNINNVLWLLDIHVV